MAVTLTVVFWYQIVEWWISHLTRALDRLRHAPLLRQLLEGLGIMDLGGWDLARVWTGIEVVNRSRVGGREAEGVLF